MKKNNKLILLGTALSLTAGISILGAQANADTTIDAGKYTEDAQQLQKVFTSKNKGYTLKEIEVENNNENKPEPVYELKGFNSKKTKSAKLVVKADKTSDVVKNKTKKMDSKDKKEDKALDLKNIKKSPTDAINLAKKYANIDGNPTSWKLETEMVKGKETPVYKIEFDGTAKQSSSSAESSSAKSLSKSSKDKDKNKDKEIKVEVNATNGDKIKVENED